MKLFIITSGTKVALGNGDGKLKVHTTMVEYVFSSFVTDPIYYYNNRNNDDVMKELNEDPTIKEKGNIVAKYSFANEDIDSDYKYLYANYKDVIVL
jgi:hypothetical protein